MILNFLHRIKGTFKQRSSDTVTGSVPSEGTETGIVADTETSITPDTVSAGGELAVLLKIISENAEVLKIMYGDNLPVKNIMAATKHAMAIARFKKHPDQRD